MRRTRCIATMKRYLVGGAVRDRLLGLPVAEQDWVVVGATPESMIAQGYRPVGRDFPVFLHPDTHEEHALARTERKSGHGYHGFTFHTGPEVTLEDDLWRRDLTVNAIAEDEHGTLIDPHGGRQDLDARLLRHVSDAFAEDPLRVLRVARFAARLAPLGFTIAPQTMDLMRQMVAADEVDHLTPERVWKETERALMETGRAGLPSPAWPRVYFEVLRQCGALARVMPELAALHGVPQRAEHHPEIDTLVHTLMCVDVAVRDGLGLEVRVAALLHDLGKGTTARAQWPRHIAHEQRGLPLVRRFCERLRVPAAARDLALTVTREHLLVHRVTELRAPTLLELMERLDAFRRPDRFELALQACECDARGRLGLQDRDYPQADWLRRARQAAQVRNAEVLDAGFSGAEVGREIRRRRLLQLDAYRRAG